MKKEGQVRADRSAPRSDNTLFEIVERVLAEYSSAEERPAEDSEQA